MYSHVCFIICIHVVKGGMQVVKGDDHLCGMQVVKGDDHHFIPYLID